MVNARYSIKEMTLLSAMTAILVVQEFALNMLPNIQFTTLLLVVYSHILGAKRTSLIIVLYVILDNLLMGSFNIIYFPSMLAAWLLVPFCLHLFFKDEANATSLALFGFLFAFVYGWMFVPASIALTGVRLTDYLLADLPFQLIMAVSNFLTILWLFEPLSKKLMDLLPIPSTF